jgi:hypothetical protein
MIQPENAGEQDKKKNYRDHAIHDELSPITLLLTCAADDLAATPQRCSASGEGNCWVIFSFFTWKDMY